MREILIQGLAPGTEYDIQVRSLSDNGVSVWSSPLRIETESITFGGSDGLPPSHSPTIYASNSLKSILIFFEGVENADPITYEYHVSTTSGFTPTPATLLAESDSTMMPFSIMPNGTAMEYETTYYFRVIAKDVDGAAGPSNIVSGQLTKTVAGDLDEDIVFDLEAANGKNRLYYDSSEPTGGNYTEGDTWFDTDNNNKMYTWNGTEWTPILFGEAAFDAVINDRINTAGADAAQALIEANDAHDVASQAADDALAAAGIANSKGKVIIQNTAPATADRLPQNLWIDTTGGTNTPKRWVGSPTNDWVAVTDKAATDAAAAAATAQTTANNAATAAGNAATAAGNAQTIASSKSRVWYQDSQPPLTGNKEADTWFDTNDGNKIYRWREATGQWTPSELGSSAISNDAINSDKLAPAVVTDINTGKSKNKTVTNGGTPSGTFIAGDIWIDTNDDNHMHRYNGTSWVSVQDGSITAASSAASAANQAAINANNAANAAQTTANSKNKTFIQSGTPSPPTASAVGDIWIDTSNNNELKRWNGTTWASARDTTIAIADGKAVAAQNAANQAIQDAEDANDEALAAAGIANSKGKVIIQPTAPAVADRLPQNLWIDTTGGANTPKRWVSGPNWTAVTDKVATDAAAAAVIADGKAVNAQTAANTAQTTANGKNKIIRSTLAASGTDYKTGDMWWRIGGEGNSEVIAMWTYNEATTPKWQPQTLTDSVVTNLSADTITAGTISADRINTAGLTIGGSTLGIELASKETPTGAQAKADAVKADVQSYVQSRGTNLITNGTALLKDNTNFSTFGYNPADAPEGAFASFTGGATRWADEIVPVNPEDIYLFNFSARQVSGDGNIYSAILPLDSSGLTIQHFMVSSVENTLTELAAPLNPGDTTIQLVSSANWHGGGTVSLRYITFWDYTDPFGKTWEPLTYSRNYIDRTRTWESGGIVGNTINLIAPYNGPAKPAGTKLSNTRSGGSYIYPTSNKPVPEDWTFFSGTFGGLQDPYGSWGAGNTLPAGCAGVRVGWLLCYAGTDPSRLQAIGNVAVYPATEALAAQAAAEEAYTRWAPTGETTIHGGKITTDSIDSAQIAANAITANELAVGAITAGKAIIANGAISNAQIADATIEAAKIKNANITTAKIANLAVQEAKIANGAVTNLKVANAAIDEANIVDAAITEAKIKDAAIKTAHIDAAQITNALIQNGAITNAKIEEATIEAGKIKSLDAGTISSGYISSARIQSDSIDATKLKSVLVISSNITTGQSGRRVSLSPSGLKAFDVPDSEGNDVEIFSIPTDPSQPAFFRGEFEAESLLVKNKLSIRGQLNDISTGAKLVLANTIGRPPSPGIEDHIPSFNLIPSGLSNTGPVKRGPDGNWYTWYIDNDGINYVRITGLNTGGLGDYDLSSQPYTVIFTTPPEESSGVIDFDFDSSTYLMTVERSTGYGTRGRYVRIKLSDLTYESKYDLVAQEDIKLYYDYYQGCMMTAFVDKIAAQLQVRVDRMPGLTASTMSVIPSASTSFAIGPNRNGSILLGAVDSAVETGGSGTTFAFSTSSSNGAPKFYHIDGFTTGNLVAANHFTLPTGAPAFAHWSYDRTAGRTIGSSSGNVYPLSNYNATLSASTNRYAGAVVSYYDSDSGGTGQHESLVSDIASIIHKKRYWLKVTSFSLPPALDNDSPNKVRFYTQINTTSAPTALTSFRRNSTDLPNGVTTELFELTPATGTSYRPNLGTLPDFPAGNAAILESAVGGFKVHGNGLGSWPLADEHSIYVYRRATSAQTLSTGVLTRMALGTQIRTGFHGGFTYHSGGAIQVPRTGRYRLEGNITFAASNGGTRRAAAICVHDVATTAAASAPRVSYNEACGSNGTTGTPSCNLSSDTWIEAGQWVSLIGFHDAGSNLGTRPNDAGGSYVFLNISYLGSN